MTIFAAYHSSVTLFGDERFDMAPRWEISPTGSSSYPDGDWQWDGGYKAALDLWYGDAHFLCTMRARKLRRRITTGEIEVQWIGTGIRRSLFYFEVPSKPKSFRSKKAWLSWLEESLQPRLETWHVPNLMRAGYAAEQATCVYRQQGEDWVPFCTMFPSYDGENSRCRGAKYSLPSGEYYMIEVGSGAEYRTSRSGRGYVASFGGKDFLPLHRWDGLRAGFYHARRTASRF